MTDDEQQIAQAIARAFETLSERLSKELEDAFNQMAQLMGLQKPSKNFPAAASPQISHCIPVIGADFRLVPSAQMGNSSMCCWTDFARAPLALSAPATLSIRALRVLFVSAAAKRWNVDPASCRAQSGEVLHAPTARSIKYGELAADAAGMPVPESVALKRPEDFELIGTPAKRLDAPAKVNGSAIYGIDVRPPGVRIATLAQSPVFGGRVKTVDDAAAKAVNGVRQIVRLDDAIAVVADHMGAAKKGLAALVIEWDDGPHAKLTTDEIAGELEKATLDSGPVAQNIGDVDKAMANAVSKVEAIYQVPFLAHAAMEPMNCTVHVRKDGCEIWVGSQVLARAQAAAAKTAGLPLDKAVLHNHLIGGGFGRRLEIDGVIRAVEIAKHVEGPVKGRVDARGRYPARYVSALLVRPNFRRSRWERNPSRVEPSLRRLLDSCKMAPSGVQRWS